MISTLRVMYSQNITHELVVGAADGLSRAGVASDTEDVEGAAVH